MIRASQKELSTIRDAMDGEKEVRVFKRYQALYLFLSGRTCRETAKIVGITKDTVVKIHKAYQNEGLKGLLNKSVGRPSWLTNEQQTALKSAILNKSPCEVGLAAELNWTADLIGKYIQREYGYQYSICGITGMLGRMGFSYTRSTYVLAKAHKQKQ